MITNKLHHLSRVAKRALLFIALLLLIENITLSFNNLQNKRAIVGLMVNGEDVTGADRTKLVSILKKEIAKSYHPVKLVYQDKIFEIKPEEFGATIDVDVVANQLIAEGRRGTLLKKFIEQQKALFGLKNIPLSRTVSQTLLTLKLLELQDQINVNAAPMMPDFKGDIKKTLPPHDGVKINTGKLTILIMNTLFNPPKDSFPIPIVKTFPTSHTEDELVPIRTQAQEAIQSSITITSGGLVFTLTPTDIRNLLAVVERPSPQDPKKIVLQLRLDDKELNKKLGAFAVKVEEITHAEFDDHDARVAMYAQFYAKNRRLVAIPTGRNFERKSVLGDKTPAGPKIAYLTFDDGPNSIYYPLTLDILKQYNVKATFFLVGQNTQRDIDVAKRTVLEGHVIGNHSLTHSFLPNFSTNAIYKELNATNSILTLISHQNIGLFRPPYGGVNVAVKQSADTLGLKLFLWDVDPRDWSEPPVDELVRRVVAATTNGSNILLHSNHLTTVRALPRIIETLTSQGYAFETLK